MRIGNAEDVRDKRTSHRKVILQGRIVKAATGDALIFEQLQDLIRITSFVTVATSAQSRL
jgi:hypothetical protein